MMQDQFVPYILAFKLKELGLDKNRKFNSDIGFDEPCFARYRRSKFQLNTLGKPHRYNSNEIVGGDVSAPLWQQAFDWFRVDHNLESSIIFQESYYEYGNKNVYEVNIENNTSHNSYFITPLEGFKTYKEARLACLIKLIEIVKIVKNEITQKTKEEAK